MSSSVRIRSHEQHHLPSLTYSSPPSSSNGATTAGPSYESYTARPSPNALTPPQASKPRSFRPWSFSARSGRSPRPEHRDQAENAARSDMAHAGGVNGSAGSSSANASDPRDDEVNGILRSYEQLRVADERELPAPPVPERPVRRSTPRPHRERSGRWSDSDDEDHEPDAYSWVDPSAVGTEALRQTPMPLRQSYSEPPSPIGTASRAIRAASRQPVRVPPSPTLTPSRPGLINQADSYNMLLAYQKSTSSHSSASHGVSPVVSPFTSTEGVPSGNPDPEWHDLVDPSIREVLGRKEMKRQGLWWELIKSEMDYVRDLRILCEGIIEPMRTHHPPLITPENRLHAFITEVFSTIPEIFSLQEQMLERLLQRQRMEWPIITSATDILLGTYLEGVDLYETYMKNFPFSETRVKRECRDNPSFAAFLHQRNTPELSGRRDIFVFLSRPVTRLPRVLLILEAIGRHTAEDHPDMEEIPTIKSVLEAALKSTQEPGIESAEAKISLWNIGEKLMFRRGEIIDVDIPEPKRTLVHSGYVFRRVRSETNWHGWQDLHAILMDNYFILTRDEEQGGRHIVVSRPIHIDFLELVSADGVPERRHDYIKQVRRKQSGNLRGDGSMFPDRLMYPFSIALMSGASSKTYTLCVSSQSARAQWKEKIENAKALRRYDIENNRTFAIHTIYIPRDVNIPGLTTADTFSWLGRETVVVGAGRSVWFGWRRDSQTYREIIRFSGNQMVSTVTIVPDFGWLLVVVGGALVAFNMRDMIPTHEPSTWIKTTRSAGVELSSPEAEVGLVRVGTTKGRLLVVHASYMSRSNQTLLTFEEPLHASSSHTQDPRTAFRRFAQLTVPGFASEVGFFRQTIAIVTERTFIVAEPGNPNYNVIPVLPSSMSPSSRVARMTSQAKPKAMYQVAEHEFLLAYDWGGCFTTRYGEISRNGAFMRWNLTPSYVAFRPPYLLLFDEEGGRAEVRHASTGKVIEVVEWRGMKPLRLTRAEQGMLAISPNGLVEVVETVAL